MSASDVRQNVRDSILEIGGWTESPTVFGPRTDPSSWGHKYFSIIMNGEDNLGIYRDNQRTGIRVRQELVVRFAYRLRPNASGDQLRDYDEAIGTATTEIVQRLMGFEENASHRLGIVFQYDRSDRLVADSGKWALIDVAFAADHNRALG